MFFTKVRLTEYYDEDTDTRNLCGVVLKEDFKDGNGNHCVVHGVPRDVAEAMTEQINQVISEWLGSPARKRRPTEKQMEDQDGHTDEQPTRSRRRAPRKSI